MQQEELYQQRRRESAGLWVRCRSPEVSPHLSQLLPCHLCEPKQLHSSLRKHMHTWSLCMFGILSWSFITLTRWSDDWQCTGDLCKVIKSRTARTLLCNTQPVSTCQGYVLLLFEAKIWKWWPVLSWSSILAYQGHWSRQMKAKEPPTQIISIVWWIHSKKQIQIVNFLKFKLGQR